MFKMPLGKILVRDHYITQNQLDFALEKQKTSPNKRIGEILVELGYIKETDIINALGKKLNLKIVDLDIYPIDVEAVKMIPEQIARKSEIIAIAKSNNTITVAACDYQDIYLDENIKIITGLKPEIVLTTRANLKKAINKNYSQHVADSVAENIDKENKFLSKEDISDLVAGLDEKIDSTPVVMLVNSIISQAYNIGASDIHIEPFRSKTKVRMRVDGDLIEQMQINVSAHNNIITRLKILGGMNIAEKRIPQDGRFEMNTNGIKIDLRVSSLPTVFGEKVVIRLLNSDGERILKMEELGMGGDNLNLFKRAIKSPNGIILVTGPTGSGKTTTLCSALGELSKPNVNIVTLEDPVEKNMPDINQVQINNKAGLTFAEGLKSILRQDPDIIMLGEIRDAETAQIAIRAAITGHLVLSTLHTNDAASSISRLVDMGIEPFLVSASLVAVMAQRLIKKLCPDCKRPYESTFEDMELLELEKPITLYEPVGCPRCSSTGFKGRTAIHEIILVNEDLKRIISSGGTNEEIREFAKKMGTSFLKDNACVLARAGYTSTHEVMKICFSID